MYVVYVNHPTSKAMIHRSDCSRFTRRRADTTMNGYWKWPFSSYQEAEAFAKNTGKKILVLVRSVCPKIPNANLTNKE